MLYHLTLLSLLPLALATASSQTVVDELAAIVPILQSLANELVNDTSSSTQQTNIANLVDEINSGLAGATADTHAFGYVDGIPAINLNAEYNDFFAPQLNATLEAYAEVRESSSKSVVETYLSQIESLKNSTATFDTAMYNSVEAGLQQFVRAEEEGINAKFEEVLAKYQWS